MFCLNNMHKCPYIWIVLTAAYRSQHFGGGNWKEDNVKYEYHQITKSIFFLSPEYAK
jgi:hypothetical protein